jgi:hypothetical protein
MTDATFLVVPVVIIFSLAGVMASVHQMYQQAEYRGSKRKISAPKSGTGFWSLPFMRRPGGATNNWEFMYYNLVWLLMIGVVTTAQILIVLAPLKTPTSTECGNAVVLDFDSYVDDWYYFYFYVLIGGSVLSTMWQYFFAWAAADDGWYFYAVCTSVAQCCAHAFAGITLLTSASVTQSNAYVGGHTDAHPVAGAMLSVYAVWYLYLFVVCYYEMPDKAPAPAMGSQSHFGGGHGGHSPNPAYASEACYTCLDSKNPAGAYARTAGGSYIGP